MKKLFFAGALVLAMLQSCNNSEGQINQEEQQHQTFASKITAKGELPPLSPEDEKALIEEAVENLRLSREAELKEVFTERRSQILCHTNYNSDYGHACVYSSSGYLVTVTWSPEFTPDHGQGGIPIPGTIQYNGSVTPRCNC